MKILYRADRDMSHLLTTALMSYEMFILFKIFFRRIYLEDLFRRIYLKKFIKKLFEPYGGLVDGRIASFKPLKGARPLRPVTQAAL